MHAGDTTSKAMEVALHPLLEALGLSSNKGGDGERASWGAPSCVEAAVLESGALAFRVSACALRRKGWMFNAEWG
jgi:hypothetical protein